MTRTSLRLLAGIASVAALTACGDSNSATTDPTAQTAFEKGSSNTTQTSTVIQLVRPATPIFARAKGKAKFEVKGNERQLEVEVEELPAGTALVFTVGGVQIGTATANALGHAEVDLNSKRNANVPLTVAGLSVVVSTPANAVVVSGTF